jgi:AcrR family transcriptional regulator
MDDTIGSTAHEHSRDTRSRLREVALQLFAEQGYEKTSLREIAERLGVTKAALYYYYPSKEDIVRSLVEDYMGQMDELIEWARGQRSSGATKVELIRRYLDIVANGAEVFRMLQQNQAAVSSLASAKERGELFKERMDALVDLLTGPDATLRDQVRASSCLMAISVGCMHYQRRAADPAELRDAILEVAMELVDTTPEPAQT